MVLEMFHLVCLTYKYRQMAEKDRFLTAAWTTDAAHDCNDNTVR